MTTMLERSAQLTAAAMVAKKYSEGDVGAYIALNGPAQYQADVETLTAEILALETRFREPLNGLAAGGVNLTPAHSKTRAATTPPKTGGARASVSPEDVRAFLADGRQHSLQEIAVEFAVSKGQAERALSKIEGVTSATGPQASGKRGKPPTVYFIMP